MSGQHSFVISMMTLKNLRLSDVLKGKKAEHWNENVGNKTLAYIIVCLLALVRLVLRLILNKIYF